MKSRREQNRTDQRERILDAARALFASRGVEEVTIAEVGERAGVARATVFNYFPSKYALVEAITEEVLCHWVWMLDLALERDDVPTPALVRALFDRMGEGIEQAHEFYRRVFREIMKVQVGLDEGGAAQRTGLQALERLEQLLVRGQGRGELRADLDVADLARAFDSLANGTIIHWLYDGGSGTLRARMQSVAEIFLGAVATPGSADAQPPADFFPALEWLPPREAPAKGGAA
jgi:AcrR family transcriptional regulator